jgi:nucleotide-binding universal stress UspA family protein
VTQIDQFESAFNAAAKEPYRYEDVRVQSVLVMTDLPDDESEKYIANAKKYLDVLGQDATWEHVPTRDLDIAECVAAMKQRAPDLLVSYRNLNNPNALPTYSLGDYLDVLLMQVAPPVLVTPHPKTDRAYEWAGINTDSVMVVTDHLVGDHKLVSWGARFTEEAGTLWLTHVEDDAVFERYMRVIGRIPTIDTDSAREDILAQLLKEPRDYIESARERLREAGVQAQVEDIVVTGHRIADYRKLVEKHNVDLLCFHTQDEDHQVAMHGVAYALACELDRVPLLML